MIIPSQRIPRVVYNPLILQSSSLAKIEVEDNGTHGDIEVLADGPNAQLKLTSHHNTTISGGQGPLGTKLTLEPNIATLDVPGAMAFVAINCSEVSIGTAGGTLAFRGLPPALAPSSPSLPTTAVIAGADTVDLADLQQWVVEVNQALLAVKNALDNQGLAI